MQDSLEGDEQYYKVQDSHCQQNKKKRKAQEAIKINKK